MRVEQLLGELVEADPRFFGEFAWLQAVVGRGTASSATMLLRLICAGILRGRDLGAKAWHLRRYFAHILQEYPEIQSELIQCYENRSVEIDQAFVEQVISYLDTYELHRVGIADLRRRLFAMIEDSPAEAELAGACLTAIDALRDTYGRTYSEPRHPDIESGRPWPLAAGEMTERAFGREPTPHLLGSSL